MLQNQSLTKKPLAEVGEEIGLELGIQMVKDYQVTNPNDTQHYIIGKNIIEQILAQPGCVGIKLFNAYNETGEKTLVYLGVKANGKSILNHTVITKFGELSKENGIVADRVKTGGGGGWPAIAPGADDWSWVID